MILRGETLFDLDQEELSENENVSREIRDKRERRHTTGILSSATPCGNIAHIAELFS